MAEAKKPKKQKTTAVAVPSGLTDAVVKGDLPELDEANIQIVSHSVDALAYTSVDLYNEEAVWNRLKLYVSSCKRNGMRPTPPGLANWLGVSSEDLRDWMLEPGDENHRRLATRLYEFLRSSWADYALTGKTPASIAIFVAKNWFAMSDTNKVADAPQVKQQLDLEKLAAEAAALPESDIIEMV